MLSRGLRESSAQSRWHFHFRRFNSQSDHEFGRLKFGRRPEFLRDFWSGPILASDDIREHMGEAKNGPDRRLHVMVKPHYIMMKPHHVMVKPHRIMMKPHHITIKPHHIMVKPHHVITNDHIRKLWLSINSG